ncbi:Uncharacterized protein conserved in bacteria [Yersinia pseudotuberculosis]|uniref:DUF2213 domain-containing protein n=1 Tax=Yersinia pseudotuberculosis TaxID=633 RepID=A0ABM7ACU4_YERPU|nr:DUF2213 domain-containing protein [Yersinia pseudotuberculosis]AIN15539.1 hypothetical protein DJ40_3633 [Yersinia pseudotuberculosis]AYW90223.1 DUF2213 domain-containing protein [Yersinia pseudotuberculosis]MBO1563269.1 DUF2213 domain-containing protein [Yersinia pseudotuberculosis]PSH14875.1 hypothetical protein BLA52_16800 [Yersinia pseudotuberculosis]PSH25317.1 hypothetical protein BLA50_12670 [Yersinia pseudotuberculosis]
MQYFYNSRLGETRFTMSDGGLLCKDVPIGRTGVQLYGGEELDDIEPDSDGEILVERTEDEVFRPETLASFEGMTFTVSHPIEDVTPDNWGRYAAGHVQNVRRGTGDQSDLMIADIVVKKAEAIKVILEEGVDQISSGYDAEYQQTAIGKARQYDIIANHVALVPTGRAGKRCSIGDSKRMTMNNTWFAKLRRAIKTKDAAAMEEAMESAPSELTSDEGTGELPKAINITINPQQPLPKQEPELDAIATNDSGDIESRVAAMETTLAAILEKLGATTDADPDEEEEGRRITSDAAYHQDVVSRAEWIVPGIKLPEGGKLASFKRTVLDAAFKTTEGEKLLKGIVGDKPDFAKMPKLSLDAAFIAASEIAKGRNNTQVNHRTIDSAAPNRRPTAADLNKQNAAFWAKKGN